MSSKSIQFLSLFVFVSLCKVVSASEAAPSRLAPYPNSIESGGEVRIDVEPLLEEPGVPSMASPNTDYKLSIDPTRKNRVLIERVENDGRRSFWGSVQVTPDGWVNKGALTLFLGDGQVQLESGTFDGDKFTIGSEFFNFSDSLLGKRLFKNNQYPVVATIDATQQLISPKGKTLFATKWISTVEIENGRPRKDKSVVISVPNEIVSIASEQTFVVLYTTLLFINVYNSDDVLQTLRWFTIHTDISGKVKIPSVGL